MQFRFKIFLFFILPPFAAFAQDSYTTIKTTNEKTVKNFKKGREAMQAGDVAGSIRSYREATVSDEKCVDAWIYLGGAYREGGSLPESEQAFEKAIALAPAYDMRVYDVLAGVEWSLDKFAESAAHLKMYIDSETGSDRDRNKARARLRNAEFAAKAIQHVLPFEPRPLGEGVNTKSDEYLPVLTADGQTLIFTRRDGGDENFYQSERAAPGVEEWKTATAMEGVNTAQNEGAQAISPDGSWLVFTACDRRGDGSQGNCDLYWSQKKETGWTSAKPFSKTINSPAWDGQPTISADGKTIIFSSERDGGPGGRDLFETVRGKDGRWSIPTPLKGEVNTIEHDQLPYLHPDGQTLYFTSTGHPGFGGEDIFVSRKRPDGSWGTPENLGYPINTKGNEGSLTTSLDGRTAYYFSLKPGSSTGIDIYYFEMPPSLRPKPVTYVRAIVTDAATRYPLVSNVEVTDLAKNENYTSAVTKKDGSFLVCIPAGHSYALNVNKKGYLFHSEHFEPDSNATLLEPFLLKIALQPIQTRNENPVANKAITLKNVFFATGSAELQRESTAELDALAELLKDNPELKIQINGHTDNIGDAAANLSLSEQRAKAVEKYLLQKEIDAERLRAKGFGETEPIDTNETAEGRANNRRTEFQAM